MTHDGHKAECAAAPRTEKTEWTSDRSQVTCPVCKGKAK